MRFIFPFYALLFIVPLKPFAQNFQTAVEYMDYIGKANDALSEKYISYLSGVSHGKSARKVEKRRQEVLNSITETRLTIQGMPAFQGDKELRDSSVAYYKILIHVFNEEYGKIVNMEEIAEQSYDAMEAYMLAQQKANEKLEAASAAQHEAEKKFAAKHNINLIENQSILNAKVKLSNAVQEHYHEVYLVFFKSYKQEAYLTEAVNKKNIVAIEQNLNSLQKSAEEGLEKLKAVKGYNNDPTLITACREFLNFCKEEGQKGTFITDFYLKEENFEKIKKSFDASSRSKQDVDQYNKAVKDINAAVNNYNNQNKQNNESRTRELNNWDNAVKDFLNRYMPERK